MELLRGVRQRRGGEEVVVLEANELTHRSVEPRLIRCQLLLLIGERLFRRRQCLVEGLELALLLLALLPALLQQGYELVLHLQLQACLARSLGPSGAHQLPLRPGLVRVRSANVEAHERGALGVDGGDLALPVLRVPQPLARPEVGGRGVLRRAERGLCDESRRHRATATATR